MAFTELLFNGEDTGILVNVDFYTNAERFNLAKAKYLVKETTQAGQADPEMLMTCISYNVFGIGAAKNGEYTRTKLTANDRLYKYVLNMLLLCDQYFPNDSFITEALSPSGRNYYSDKNVPIDVSAMTFKELDDLFFTKLNLLKLPSKLPPNTLAISEAFGNELQRLVQENGFVWDYDIIEEAINSDGIYDLLPDDNVDNVDNDSIYRKLLEDYGHTGDNADKKRADDLEARDIAEEIVLALEKEKRRKSDKIKSRGETDLTEAEYERRRLFQEGELLKPKKRRSVLKPTGDYKKNVQSRLLRGVTGVDIASRRHAPPADYGRLGHIYKHYHD